MLIFLKWSNDLFFILTSSCGTHLSSFLTFPIWLKCHMTIKWPTLSSSATSHVVSCRTISLDDGSQLVVVNFRWLATELLIFKSLISFAKLLEPVLHCISVSSSWAKGVMMLQVVFMTHFELE